MIISTGAEKGFDKICDKTLQKGGKEGTYLNIIKAICNKPTANIIFNGEKLKTFYLKLETRQQSPLLLFLFNIITVVQDTTIRQDKEMKFIQIEREEVKLILFANVVIIYIKR